MDEPILISVQYLPDEVNNAYWEVAKEVVVPHLVMSVFCVTFFFACATLLVASVTEGFTTDSFSRYLPFTLPLVLALVGIPLVSALVVWSFAKRKAMQSYSHRPAFHSLVKFILSSSGMCFESKSALGTLDWKSLTIAFETDESFCMGPSTSDVFVLPKRCFASVEEVKTVRKLVRAMVKNFSHIGKGRSDSSISFSTHEVSAMVVDGQQYSLTTTTFKPNELKAPDLVIDFELAPAGEIHNCLDSGFSLEVKYNLPEIIEAEKIHFFRKKFRRLLNVWLVHALVIAAILTGLGTVANGFSFTLELLKHFSQFFLIYVPIILIHSGLSYWLTMRTIRKDKNFRELFVYQISEEACGLRFGDKYWLLSWMHFQECWETNSQYILLFGAHGYSLWVIPKRCFPDRMASAYVHDLLKRKIANYKELT